MATHAGKEGTVKIGANTVAEIRTWSIEETTNTAPDTTLGDEWETHLVTTKAWTGQLECFWDETDTNGQGALTSGASVTLNVHPEGDTSGDTFYSGTATVTTITRQANNEGLVEAAFSFTGNGALSESTVV